MVSCGDAEHIESRPPAMAFAGSAGLKPVEFGQITANIKVRQKTGLQYGDRPSYNAGVGFNIAFND